MNTAETKRAHLRVGGFQPFTSVDYPGALAAVVFCQGCPLRCVYCHNQDLLPVRAPSRVEWADIYAHLAKRRGLLDAVVFSGGEPLMQGALGKAMQTVKKLGYRIGLHTSGVAPERLRAVLHLVDWIGFDVKAPFDDYEKVTGVKGAGEKARESLAMIVEAKIDTEVRTTVWPSLADTLCIKRIISDITVLGVDKFVLQEARDPVSKTPKGLNKLAGAISQNEFGRSLTELTIRRAA